MARDKNQKTKFLLRKYDPQIWFSYTIIVDVKNLKKKKTPQRSDDANILSYR